MRYDKLVRDKIPDIIKKKGGKPKYRRAKSLFIFRQKAREKLLEEAQELVVAIKHYLKTLNPKKVADEFADLSEIIEVVFADHKLKGYLAKARNKKAKERGRFKKRIILEEA